MQFRSCLFLFCLLAFAKGDTSSSASEPRFNVWTSDADARKHIDFINEHIKEPAPHVGNPIQLDKALRETLDAICGLGDTELRQAREKATVFVEDMGKRLEASGELEAWRRKMPDDAKEATVGQNGLLLHKLLVMLEYDDPEVAETMRWGAKLTGEVKAAHPDEDNEYKDTARQSTVSRRKTVQELWKGRRAWNEKLLGGLREEKFGRELLAQTKTDASLGRVTTFSPEKGGGSECLISRRFGIEQGCAEDNSLRHRCIDNGSESGGNDAIIVLGKMKCERLDSLFKLIEAMWQRGAREFELFKMDIDSAYRRITIAGEDRWIAVVAFMVNGKVIGVKHIVLPFGFVGAVHGWDRIGRAIQFILVKLVRVLCLRYVDDYFGVERARCTEHLVKCATRVIEAILGKGSVAPHKSAHGSQLVILGILVELKATAMKCTLTEGKKEKWGNQMQAALEHGTLLAGDAAKLAGRFSFAAQMIFNRYGRAMIRPIRRQEYAPLKDGKLSLDLKEAIRWWTVAIKEDICDEKAFGGCTPERVDVYCDAASTPPVIAAVLIGANVCEMAYMKAEALIPLWLQPRDAQIMGLELLAIVLALETFGHRLREKLVVIWTDNEAAEHALIRGGAGCGDHNRIIHGFWAAVRRLRCEICIARVPSKDNIADGPTRDYWVATRLIGAKCVEPLVPIGPREWYN